MTDEEIIEINLTRELYRAMPGAPAVPIAATGPQYGEVEGNRHYAFCREIVFGTFCCGEMAEMDALLAGKPDLQQANRLLGDFFDGWPQEAAPVVRY